MCLRKSRETGFNDTGRNACDLGKTEIGRVNVRAADLAEVAGDVWCDVERGKKSLARDTHGLPRNADPSSERCAAEATTLAAMAMNDALMPGHGANLHCLAIANG